MKSLYLDELEGGVGTCDGDGLDITQTVSRERGWQACDLGHHSGFYGDKQASRERVRSLSLSTRLRASLCVGA